MNGQQLIISGVGGQGILFITRLLAEIAIAAGYPVLTSETHGMAQRGGVVISHLKVGPYTSPLVAEGQADGLILLKGENWGVHNRFLSSKGWVAANGDRVPTDGAGHPFSLVAADRLALVQGDPRSLNLIVLGAAAATGRLFCSVEDIRGYLASKGTGKQGAILRQQQSAFEAGITHAVEVVS